MQAQIATEPQYHSLNQTLMNQLNSSKSKFQYSFSKAERFKFNSRASDYKYYDKPPTNHMKANRFGTGKRSTLGVDNDIPPATRYTPLIGDQFDSYAKPEISKKKGFSFSAGREETAENSFIKLNSNPGPGNYKPNPQVVSNVTCYGFSMTKDSRFRDKESKSQLSTISVPGPGQYAIKSSLGGKNKILSQDKNNNPCPKLISEKTESRRIHTEPQKKIYNPLVTSKGDFVTFNAKRGFSMGKSKRTSFIKNKDVPGPGKYRAFSEFIKPHK